MQQVSLKFYVSEKQRHQGELLHEWLLQEAGRMGVPGGSAFRAIAGYGRHHRLHEQTFFELAGELPVMVEFVLEPSQADQLCDRLRGMGLLYVRHAVECGTL